MRRRRKDCTAHHHDGRRHPLDGQSPPVPSEVPILPARKEMIGRYRRAQHFAVKGSGVSVLAVNHVGAGRKRDGVFGFQTQGQVNNNPATYIARAISNALNPDLAPKRVLTLAEMPDSYRKDVLASCTPPSAIKKRGGPR